MTEMILVIVGAAAAVPIAVVLMVSVASRREDSTGSLNGQPRGPVQATARRILGFHSEGLYPPVRGRQPRARAGIAASDTARKSSPTKSPLLPIPTMR